MLSYEMAEHDPDIAQRIEDVFFLDCPGAEYHFRWSNPGTKLAGWAEAPQPSTRAAIVVSAVGCPLG